MQLKSYLFDLISHMAAVLSNDPVRRRLPSLLNRQFITSAPWWRKVCNSCAVSIWKILAVPSMEAEQIVSSVMGWNCAETTSAVWPIRVLRHNPEEAHQILMVVSKEPVTTRSLEDVISLF